MNLRYGYEEEAQFGNEIGGTPGIQRDMCAAFRIVAWKI